MKRSGFTMIELIFVIVILGILASVAIPKLAATRDDAKISKAASEVSTLVSDLGAYYTGHGTFETNLTKMTNVQLANLTTDKKTTSDLDIVTLAKKKSYNDLATGKDCLTFYVTTTDGNLTVGKGTGTTTYCKGLQAAVKDLVKTHQFGGSSVSFN